mgnify:CR=1 FL=1
MFKAISALMKLMFGFITITSDEGLGIYGDVLKTTRVWSNCAVDISKAEAKEMMDEYNGKT